MIEILKNRSIIHLFGGDAAKFLQGQTTNDIIKNQYSYNFILNNQGRYLFDFFVYRKSDNSFFIDIHYNAMDAFIKRLSMYKLRSEVEFENVSDDFFITYSKKILKDAVFSMADPRDKRMSFRSMFLKNKLNKIESYTKDLYINDKYEYSIIDGIPDLIYEKSIPIEYGADDMHAIDYQKGCYIGQEVISRAKYQGVIRKKIYKLKFGTEIAFITTGAVITDLEGNKIGIVCSFYGKIAIALIREEKYLGLSKKVAIIGDQSADILVPPWRN